CMVHTNGPRRTAPPWGVQSPDQCRSTAACTRCRKGRSSDCRARRKSPACSCLQDAIAKLSPAPCLDRRARVAHQVVEHVYVVIRKQARAEHLVGAEEMRQICARERLADKAAALR